MSSPLASGSSVRGVRYFFLATDFSGLSALPPAHGASSRTPRSSCSSSSRYSLPLSFTVVPANEPKSTRSPGLTVIATRLPSSSILPAPTATTRPSVGFSFAVSGSTIPPAVLSCDSTRSTSTLSWRGLIFAIVVLCPRAGGCRLVPSDEPQRGEHHVPFGRQGPHRRDPVRPRRHPEIRRPSPRHPHEAPSDPFVRDRADRPPAPLARDVEIAVEERSRLGRPPQPLDRQPADARDVRLEALSPDPRLHLVAKAAGP